MSVNWPKYNPVNKNKYDYVDKCFMPQKRIKATTLIL